MTAHETLWYWIREREEIRKCKERGNPPPWTHDPILSTYRFCNVRREDDRVTIWIRDNIRKPFANHHLLWLMLCIARQINWPETLKELMGQYNAWPFNWSDFSLEAMVAVLDSRKRRGDKIFTGAYIIPPGQAGVEKHEHICLNVIGGLWNARRELSNYIHLDPTLEGTHIRLTRHTGWGRFLAYQAVVDMRFTPLLDQAEDIDTWAAAGPGTIRGLNRIHARPIDQGISHRRACDEMLELFSMTYGQTGITVDFSDIPNVLCEMDKYIRLARSEGRVRALYVEGRGY